MTAILPNTQDRLPFTVVDEAVHHLDTESEPWSIEVELAVEGRLDESRLRKALGDAVARHPMARARRLPARRSDHTYDWAIDPALGLDPLAVVDCSDDDALRDVRDSLQSLSVPLLESPPFRLRLVHHPDGDRLLLNANHAAFDGFGCVRLLQSVARSYAEAPDPQPEVDLAEARDLERHLTTDDPEAKAKRRKVLADKAADLVRGPARIAPDEGRDEPGYGIVHRSLSAEETARLDDDDQPGTVNDLLMSALHLAIDSWNASHGASARRITVLMPVNLRPKEWRTEMVTNFVLMARVCTLPADRTDPSATVRTVSEQTEYHKKWGTGAALIDVLRRTAKFPLWAKQSLSPLLWLTGNRLVCTALLTNLGEVEDPPAFGGSAGDTTGIWFSAPARLPCGVSVGAVTVDGRLHLSFRTRPPLLGPDASERFADQFLTELRRLAERPGATSTDNGQTPST